MVCFYWCLTAFQIIFELNNIYTYYQATSLIKYHWFVRWRYIYVTNKSSINILSSICFAWNGHHLTSHFNTLPVILYWHFSSQLTSQASPFIRYWDEKSILAKPINDSMYLSWTSVLLVVENWVLRENTLSISAASLWQILLKKLDRVDILIDKIKLTIWALIL